MNHEAVDPFEEWRRSGGTIAKQTVAEADGPVAMQRVWSDTEVQKRAQDCLAAWNEDERPRGFGSQLFFWGVIVFLFVPFLGWIVGIVMIGAAFCDGKTPEERSKQDVERYARLKKELSNCYRGVVCPKCGTDLVLEDSGMFVFLEDPEGLDCPICRTRLIRRGDTLTVFEP